MSESQNRAVGGLKIPRPASFKQRHPLLESFIYLPRDHIGYELGHIYIYRDFRNCKDFADILELDDRLALGRDYVSFSVLSELILSIERAYW